MATQDTRHDRSVAEVAGAPAPPETRQDRPVAEVTGAPAPPASRQDRPVGELVGDLAAQTSMLVRQELELAKVELTAKGKRAGLGAGMFGAAGICSLFALGALTACAIFALDYVVAGWLAALITAGFWFLVAGILALVGAAQAKRATPLAPEQTIETTKDDIAVTKARVKEARS